MNPQEMTAALVQACGKALPDRDYETHYQHCTSGCKDAVVITLTCIKRVRS